MAAPTNEPNAQPPEPADAQPKQRLPLEGKSQTIGEAAKRCFEASHPLSWRPKALDGDTDVGLDFHVQVVRESAQANMREVADVFRVQLKGTEDETRLNAAGTAISVRLSGSTIRFYDRQTEPVLLVVADLTIDPNPRKCPAYWQWIHKSIRERRNQAATSVDTAASMTFQVPIENRLESFNPAPELERHRVLMRTGADLDETVQQFQPCMTLEARETYTHQVIEGLKSHGSVLLDSLAKSRGELWPTAPRESLQGKLRQISIDLEKGDDAGAMKALLELEGDVTGAEAPVRAEFAALTGRCHMLDGRPDEAIACAARAYELNPLPRYLTTWCELRLQRAIRQEDGPGNELDALPALLTGDDIEVASLRARVLMLQGDRAGAMAILDAFPADETRSTRAILSVYASDWDETVRICTEALSAPGTRRDRLFHLLRARALFHKAIGREITSEGERLPMYGPPDLDVVALQACWADLEEALSAFAKAGWPLNTEILADVWASASLYLGRQKEQLPLLRAAATARPRSAPLQDALQVVAAACGNYELALEANARLPDHPDTILRRVGLLLEGHQTLQCVRLLQERLPNLPIDHPLYLSALSMGVLAADRTVRVNQAEQFVEAIKRHPDHDAALALLTFYRERASAPAVSPQAIEQLGAAYARHPDDLPLAIQYLQVLPSEKPDGAEKIVAIAEGLRRQTQLPADVELEICQAHATLHRWSQLLVLADAAIARFPLHKRFVAIRAVALDRLGHVAEARALLATLVSNGAEDRFAAVTFVRIANRCGFLDEAIEVVDQLVANTNVREDKLGYLRLLHHLVASRDPQGQRVEEIAWQVGRYAEPTVEAEEAAFLGLYLTSTASGAVTVAPERVAEMNRRLTEFNARFPESGALRRVEFPEKLTFEALEEALQKVDPQFKQRNEVRRRLEQMLERGALPFPYAWRPRWVLDGIPDVASLWVVTTQSAASANKVHLQMTTRSEQVRRAAIRDRVPMLDLVALLVINELDLFDALFRLFDKIAISQGTYVALRRMTAPMSASWGYSRCQRILERLRTDLPRVVSPLLDPDGEDEPLDPRAISEEIKALVDRDGYLLYSDDAVFTTYVLGDRPHAWGFTTVDLICLAEEEGHISLQTASTAFTNLLRWHVGIFTPTRYLMASVPASLAQETNVAKAIEAVLSSDAGTMFREFWNVQIPYDRLLEGGTQLAAQWLGDEDLPLVAATALVGVWLQKVQFHPKVPEKTSVVRQLAVLLARASLRVERRSEVVARRFCSAFKELTAEHRHQRMEQAVEYQDIRELARVVAKMDAVCAAKGLTPGPTASFWKLGLAYSMLEVEFNDEYVRQAPDARAALRGN